MNLNLYAIMKSKNEKIDKVINRLIEIRIYLEKLQLLEEKMQYQIDKFILISRKGSSFNTSDPLFHKPNPNDLVSKEEDDDEVQEEKGNKHNKKDIYHPPKLAAVPYEEKENIFFLNIII